MARATVSVALLIFLLGQTVDSRVRTWPSDAADDFGSTTHRELRQEDVSDQQYNDYDWQYGYMYDYLDWAPPPADLVEGLPPAPPPPPGRTNSSEPPRPLQRYTAALIGQRIGVHGQSLRIPNSLFAKQACQAVYLGSPDWSRQDLHVSFVPGSLGTCKNGKRPTASFFAFVDGYRAPEQLGTVRMSTSMAPWAAVVEGAMRGGNVTGRPGSPGADSRGGVESGNGASAAEAGSRRVLSGGLTSGKAGMAMFRSSFNSLHEQTKAANDLLVRDNAYLPGPDGALSVPITGMRRQGVFPFSPPRVGAQGGASAAAAGLPANSNLVTDNINVYNAPVDDCLNLVASARRDTGGKSANVRAPRSWRRVRSTDTCDSCYITQTVVYVYYDFSVCEEEGGQGAAATQQPQGQQPSHALATTLVNATATRTSGYDWGEGYVQVTLTYQPYSKCIRKATQGMADAARMMVLVFGIILAIFVGILLLPSVYRAFVGVPVRAVRNKLAERAAKEAADSSAAASSSTTTDSAPDMTSAAAAGGLGKAAAADTSGNKPTAVAVSVAPLSDTHKENELVLPTPTWVDRCGELRFLRPLIAARKHVLYAVSTVHHPEGQSRILQVAVISAAALCVTLVVSQPRLEPPLYSFVPQLALQIADESGALAGLMLFIDVVFFSAFLGTLSFLALVANLNSPSNPRYRTQCAVSGVCSVVLVLLLLMQLGTLLSVWDHLHPRWPYFPLVFCQCVNLAAVLAMQFVIIYLRPRWKAFTTPAAEQAGKQQQQQMGAGCGGAATAALGCTPLDRWKRREDAAAAVVDFSPLTSGMRKNMAGSAVLVASRALQSDRQQQQRQPYDIEQQQQEQREQQQLREQSGDGSDVSSPAATGGADGDKGDSMSDALRCAVDGVKALWRRFWHSIRETNDFKYPAWLLAALLVASYLLLFHYGRAIQWSTVVVDCVEDPTDCMGRSVGRLYRSVARSFDRDRQVTLRDTLGDLMASRALANQLLAQAMNVTTQLTSLVRNSADTSDPDTRAVLQQQRQLAAQQLNAMRVLNGTIGTLYGSINTTHRFMARAMEVDDKMDKWREDFRALFEWTSAVGFTLGLLVSLWSLLQTAISFRRAVRKARRFLFAQQLCQRFDAARAAGGTKSGSGSNGGGAPAAPPDAQLLSAKDQLLVTRALQMPVANVVFFFGVLLSTAVIQLYIVGILLGLAFALLFHPWTWTTGLPDYGLYVLGAIVVIVLNKAVLVSYIGNHFLSDGNRIHHPAAWLAFVIIMSVTNLIVGLLIALFRILLLLITSVLSIGKLELTIFTFFTSFDLAHNSFLAGLHMHDALSRVSNPIYLPGARGRAHRRWRKLREAVQGMSSEQLQHFGRPEVVVLAGQEQ